MSVLIFIWSLYWFLKLFIAKTCWDIFGGWDARYFWNVKAKFYFRSPEDWKNMFSPIITHPDYPLLLPGSVAWGWLWAGKEFLFWPPVIALSFALSVLGITMWYLLAQESSFRSRAYLAGAYLLSLGAFLTWSVAQYADTPLCFFITSSCVLLILSLKLNNLKLLFLASLFAGMAGWTKNEGLFFMVWFGLITSGFIWKHPAFKNKKLRCLGISLLGALPFVLAIAYLKMFLATTGDYLGSGRSLTTYFSLIFGDFEKSLFIAKAFTVFMSYHTYWNALWIGFGIACIYSLITQSWKRIENKSWVLAVFILLLEASYFVVLHTTPLEIGLQLATALHRLLLHSSALAILFMFDTFTSQKKIPSDS